MNKQIKSDELLHNIRQQMAALDALVEEVNSHAWYEDRIYRFYYQSFKVYSLREITTKMVTVLKSLAPEETMLCEAFEEIYTACVNHPDSCLEDNSNWIANTRIFVEAFLHAKFFIEMAAKYGKALETSPNVMPSGWAALLCLYDLR